MSIFLYLLTFLASLFLSISFVPFAKKFAFLFNAIDKPSDRKVHTEPMPRCGGIALVLSFYVVSILIFLITFFVARSNINYPAVIGIMLGGFFIFLVGLFDDIKGLSPFTKFVFQIIAALIPISLGVSIQFISTPFTGVVLLGVFSMPLTILWIAGLVNAINFIDGLDGLAAGVSLIAALTLFVVAIKMRQPGAAILLIALSGASIGFLKYNFNPASIFLGDSGSMFLGYILATASIIGVLKSTVIFVLLIPVFVLGVPIFDTASVIFRRIKAGQPIFIADKRHLHHLLLEKGLTHRQAVLSIYVVCISLSFVTLAFTFLPLIYSTFLFVLAIAFIGFYRYFWKRNYNA